MRDHRSIGPAHRGAFVRSALISLAAVVFLTVPAHGQSLRGSSASLDLQNEQAQAHDFTYIRSEEQLRTFVREGYLTVVRGNRDFEIHAVTYPYARPEVKLFIERLAAQYRSACGEKLVVTSLTRPLNFQRSLSNGSDRSVHPTGMAVDFRRIGVSSRCRNWLEGVLLDLEGKGLVEATREDNPAHYHVVLFPQPYARYVDQLLGADGDTNARRTAVTASATPGPVSHEVRRGDTLWDIAVLYGVSVRQLQAANGLGNSRIYAGQVLEVPAGR